MTEQELINEYTVVVGNVERLLRAFTEVVRQVGALAEENTRLREVLLAWEPRVNCPQCGRRYAERACGPTHAMVTAALEGRDA